MSLGLHVVVLAATAAAAAVPCRDRLTQPFASTSIWNTAIGSNADFAPANIYPPSTLSGCDAGRADPSKRGGCPKWKPTWNETDCLAAGCCYDPHPAPDPKGYPWCYTNKSTAFPGAFYVDIDYFIPTTASDPQDVPCVALLMSGVHRYRS